MGIRTTFGEIMAAQTAWSWVVLDENSKEISQRDPETFPNQSEAETWLGENWRTLRDDGADAVKLMSDGVEVYAMSLAPAA